MKAFKPLTVLLACLVLPVACRGGPAQVLLSAGFEDDQPENFQSDFPGGKIAPTDYDYSVGRGALKCSVETMTDVERYFKHTDADTKVGFHYKACGVHTIRLLAGSVEDGENLYINFTNVPQNVWCWALVREADLRNVVPRHGGPECPYGDKTGKGKSFRNLVFHLLDADKGVDEPAVYLDNLVIYSGADTNAPVMRGAPALVAKAGERFLVWADARDDVGVAYYEVARFAEAGAAKPLRVARVVAPEFALDGAAAWYKVSPVDYAGNVGAASDAVAVPAANRE